MAAETGWYKALVTGGIREAGGLKTPDQQGVNSQPTLSPPNRPGPVHRPWPYFLKVTRGALRRRSSERLRASSHTPTEETL
jgi:hypothetical protein